MTKSARIVGTGSYLPTHRITNEEIEGMVRNFNAKRAGMPFAQWVEQVTGIKCRYFAASDDTETMAASASQIALEAAGLDVQDLDFIIVSSFTQSSDIPNVACSVGHLLGANNIAGFPLNTACAGFVYALAMGYALISASIYENILVVSSETLSRVIDFDDPATAVLFGDGAGAAILQAAENGGICSRPYLSSEYTEDFDLKNSDVLDSRLIFKRGGDQFVPRSTLHMPGGPRVLRRAVNGMADALLRALEHSAYELEDLDIIIPHQANQRIIDGLTKRLGVSKQRVCSVVEEIGNISGASVAVSLDMAIRGEAAETKISRGDTVGLTAIGGGYSVGAIVFEY